ncbi:MAG: DciA family protein, partial [bacterium]
LYVRVSSPGLRNKLTFEKEKLIRAINEACGKEIIKSIRLV